MIKILAIAAFLVALSACLYAIYIYRRDLRP